MTITYRGQLMEWIRAPITGKLEEVPGLGPANVAHLCTTNEAMRSWKFLFIPQYFLSSDQQKLSCDHLSFLTSMHFTSYKINIISQK